MIRIPALQAASSNVQQRIELDQQIVELTLTWNSREEFFYLTITDPLGSTLSGVKVVPEWPLLRQFRGAIEFRGELMVLRTNNEVGDSITYDNLGGGWDLLFLTNSEVDQWEAGRGI